MAYIALSAALVSLCAWLSVPAPIPFTMQTFAVFAVAGTERLGRGLPALLFSMAAGLVCCYAMGTAWYVAVYARAGGQAGVAAVLSACVLPFIPADAAKLLLAALLSKRLAPLCSPERRRG